MVLRRVEPRDEAELQDILVSNLDSIEPGMNLLKEYFAVGNVGEVDILLVDSENVVTIVEVKQGSDERAILQLLRYFDFVAGQLPMIAASFPDHEVDIETDPRLMLIERQIPDDTKTIACYLDPPPEMFEYTLFELENGKREIDLRFVNIPERPRGLRETPTIDGLRQRLSKDVLSRSFDQICHAVQGIDSGIKLSPTSQYVGYSLTNRLVGSLHVRKESLILKAYVLDENGQHADAAEIVVLRTGAEQYDNILDRIRTNTRILRQRPT